MKIFLFGAGGTAGTFSGAANEVPTSANFGRVLTRLRPNWPSEYPKLLEVVKAVGADIRAWSLDAIWTHMDYFAKLSMAIGKRDFGGQASRELKRALLQVYGSRCSELARRLPKNNTYTLGDIFRNKVKKGDVIVSFNYDTIVETLAERFGFKLVQVRPNARVRGTTLAKPHGSTSWAMDFSACEVRYYDRGTGRPLLEPVTPAQVARRNRRLEPLVLGAVPIKSELLKEIQDHIRCSGTTKTWKMIYDIISAQWRHTVGAIAQADEMVVVGYGFPAEDQYGRFLFREAIRLRRKDARPLSVQYYELQEKAATVAKAILETFLQKRMRLQWCGEVYPPRRWGRVGHNRFRLHG